jgi:hypothetical protein
MTNRTRLSAALLGAGAICISVLGLGAAPAEAASSPPPGFALPAHVPYYVVPADDNVFAYALASQLLGNGNLDTEIFQLNKGRLQPTGDSWTQLTTIEPGWYLVLPCSATGGDAGVSVQWNPPPQDVPPAEVPASAQCPATVGPAATPVPVATTTAAGATATAAGATATVSKSAAAVAAKSGSGGSGDVLLIVVAGLLILAAIGGFSWQRARLADERGAAGGPGRNPGPARSNAVKSSPAKPVLAKPVLAKPVLARAATTKPGTAQPNSARSSGSRPAMPKLGLPGRRRPPPVTDALLADPQTVAVAAQALGLLTPDASWWPYAVAVGVEQVTVWLAGMEVPDPVEPWQPVQDDTRAWTAARAELAEAAESETAGEDMIPAVLGVVGDAVVVLEVSRSHGVLAVGGDPRWAGRVHESLVEQLTGGEVLLRSPGEPDPVGGRPHWALDVDGGGWVTVHGRDVRFAAPAEPGIEETAPLPEAGGPDAVSSADHGLEHSTDYDAELANDPDLGSIAVSAQPPEPSAPPEPPA